MEQSLSVLLPVKNAQSTLATTVAEILEVVSELAKQVELVIVDDGSSDATSEVAHDLTRRYPQVHTVVHRESLGHEAAIRTGFLRSSGDIIFVRDEGGGSAIDAIPRLWQAVETPQLEHKRRGASPRQGRTRINSRRTARQAGYLMIDRRSMEQEHGASQPSRPNYLGRVRDFALGE